MLSCRIFPRAEFLPDLYRFIFPVECGVESESFLRAPAPIEHPIESAAMRPGSANEIEEGGGQRCRTQNKIMQPTDEQLHLKQ